MKYVLKKKFSFEAAHRLIKNYTGKCNNNHGHSFQITLELSGEELDERDMVIDFNETRALKEWVDTNLDHTSILWEGDPLIPLLKAEGNRLFICKKNPTSEHLAEIIFEKAIDFFQNSRIKVHSILINETCTSGITLYND